VSAQHTPLLCLKKPLREVVEDVSENAIDHLACVCFTGNELSLNDTLEHEKDVLKVLHVHVCLNPPEQQVHGLWKLHWIVQVRLNSAQRPENIHFLRGPRPSDAFLSLLAWSGYLLLVTAKVHSLASSGFVTEHSPQVFVFLDLLALMIEVFVKLPLLP